MWVDGGEQEPPPNDLAAVFRWRRWGIMPNSGGQRDQRYGEFERMEQALGIYDLWRWYKDRPPGWLKAGPAPWKRIIAVKSLVYGRQ